MAKKQAQSVLIGRIATEQDRPPLRMDFVGASGVAKLESMKEVVSSAKTASAAVYIAGKPADVAETLMAIARESRFSAVNATLSLRGDKPTGRNFCYVACSPSQLCSSRVSGWLDRGSKEEGMSSSESFRRYLLLPAGTSAWPIAVKIKQLLDRGRIEVRPDLVPEPAYPGSDYFVEAQKNSKTLGFSGVSWCVYETNTPAHGGFSSERQNTQRSWRHASGGFKRDWIGRSSGANVR